MEKEVRPGRARLLLAGEDVAAPCSKKGLGRAAKVCGVRGVRPSKLANPG